LRPLALEVTPSSRVRFAWALLALLIAAALCLSSTPHPAWTSLAAVLAFALGWQPGRAILFGRGPMAIRRFEWTPGEPWRLERLDGTQESGCLTATSATLGPCILLAWTVGDSRWRPGCRRYALIEASQIGQAAYRALKGRLSILASRDS
jgi:hypothetical protein